VSRPYSPVSNRLFENYHERKYRRIAVYRIKRFSVFRERRRFRIPIVRLFHTLAIRCHDCRTFSSVRRVILKTGLLTHAHNTRVHPTRSRSGSDPIGSPARVGRVCIVNALLTLRNDGTTTRCTATTGIPFPCAAGRSWCTRLPSDTSPRPVRPDKSAAANRRARHPTCEQRRAGETLCRQSACCADRNESCRVGEREDGRRPKSTAVKYASFVHARVRVIVSLD